MAIERARNSHAANAPSSQPFRLPPTPIATTNQRPSRVVPSAISPIATRSAMIARNYIQTVYSTFWQVRSSPKGILLFFGIRKTVTTSGGPSRMSFVRTVARWGCFTAAAATLTIPSFGADKKAAPKEPVTETPSYYGPQPAKENIDLTMYSRIREEGFKHSHVMEFADALTNGIGPRLTGSPNMKAANEWTKDTLTKIGLENAHLEDWGEFGMGWQQVN